MIFAPTKPEKILDNQIYEAKRLHLEHAAAAEYQPGHFQDGRAAPHPPQRVEGNAEMTTIARSRPGHWANADLNARFMDLADGDRRVSLAEQQDYMPASGDPMPVWLAISFFLVALPLLTTLVVWLVRLSLQH